MTMRTLKSESVLRALSLAALALALSSCQPYSGTAGEIKVALGASEFILLDAPAASCRAKLSNAAATDVSPLHMNLGTLKLDWDGEVGTTLKVIYVRLSVSSGNLSNADKPVTIASQDLNCIMRKVLDSGNTLVPAEKNFVFADELLIGGLKSADATNRTSFSGTINVIVYALKQREGAQDSPVVGRGSARFSFDGIF